jgi:hypothetical protein
MLSSNAIAKFSLLLICGWFLSGNLEAQKLLDAIVTYYYPSGGDSVKGAKIVNEYNDTYRQTTHSIYSWDKSSNRWEGWSFPAEECMVCVGRFEYAYDDGGHMVSSIAKFWDLTKNVLLPIEKMLYDFDSIGRKTMEIRQNWVDSISNWVNLTKKEWYFDTGGIKTEIVSYNWDLSNNSCIWKENERHKIENVYNLKPV